MCRRGLEAKQGDRRREAGGKEAGKSMGRKGEFLNKRDYCLISYREGLGTSLQIMGLATVGDPHSQNSQNPQVWC